MSENNGGINKRLALAGALILLCITGLAVTAASSVTDLNISEALFSLRDPYGLAVSAVGTLPMYLLVIVFLGALLQRAMVSERARGLKAGITLLLGVFASFMGSATLCDKDCLGGVVDGMSRNPAWIIPVFAVVFLPMLPVGYRAAKRNGDARLAKILILTAVFVLAGYLLMTFTKDIMHRPRYRSKVSCSLDFVPWFERFSGYTAGLPEKLGIDKGEFRSFPSGHAVIAMSCFITVPALSALFKGLRGREFMLSVCGACFGIMVMLARVIVGAHYLNDVCAGALLMLACSSIYLSIMKKTAYFRKEG